MRIKEHDRQLKIEAIDHFNKFFFYAEYKIILMLECEGLSWLFASHMSWALNLLFSGNMKVLYLQGFSVLSNMIILFNYG